MKRVYFDQDGVLAEYKVESTDVDYAREGYYSELKPTKVVEYVNSLIKANIAEVYVITIYYKKPAFKEKDEWMSRYLPSLDSKHRIILPWGSSKPLEVEKITGCRLSSNDILVDDHTPNCLDWQSFGGMAIKWINGINGNRNRFNGLRIDNLNELDSIITGGKLLWKT
jgi:5'(3')-deoxyribonucleotidase